MKLKPLYDYQEKSIYNRLFYKRFHQDKNVLHNQLLKQTSFNILYLSEIYKDTGGPLSKFYIHDQIHLTAEGGELLAKKIDQVIKGIEKKK